jgi:chromosome segregation ATPase
MATLNNLLDSLQKLEDFCLQSITLQKTSVEETPLAKQSIISIEENQQYENEKLKMELEVILTENKLLKGRIEENTHMIKKLQAKLLGEEQNVLSLQTTLEKMQIKYNEDVQKVRHELETRNQTRKIDLRINEFFEMKHIYDEIQQNMEKILRYQSMITALQSEAENSNSMVDALKSSLKESKNSEMELQGKRQQLQQEIQIIRSKYHICLREKTDLEIAYQELGKQLEVAKQTKERVFDSNLEIKQQIKLISHSLTTAQKLIKLAESR